MGHVDFDHPDETRTFPNGRWDIVHAGTSTIARGTLEPGWKWSTDVKPIRGPIPASTGMWVLPFQDG